MYIYIYTYTAVVLKSYLQTAILCWKKLSWGLMLKPWRPWQVKTLTWTFRTPLYVMGKTNYSLGDCVTFRGLLNLIALRREGEQYVFKFVRSCLFTQPAEDNFIVLNMCIFYHRFCPNFWWWIDIRSMKMEYPKWMVYDGLRCHSNGYLGRFPPLIPIVYAPYIHNYPYCCCLNLIKSHCIPICLRKLLHVGWIHPTICMFSWTQTLNIPPKKTRKNEWWHP